MSEPLWTSNVKVVFLACDEDGNLIAITGDGGSPSLFLRWTRLRAEDGGRSRVIFQQVTLLDGEQDDAEIGVSLQDSGAVVAWGRQTLAFVDKENECRLSAFDPTRPVPRLKKDDRGIVTFVDGSTVEDSVAVSGDVLLRFGPGGREQLHEIAPVLFDVDYRDDPREMPSWIKKAFRDPLGNVALATSTGHVYYHNAVTGELTVLSEPEVREGGSPSTPHKRTIAIDAQGRVLDWFEDPDDRKGWRLYVWQHGDETAREVFEYRVEYVKRSESVTASTLLPNGDLIFTTHFRRGDERKYRSDRPAQRGAWSAVCRVSADRWNETVQVFEMEWDDPWARMWICSVAEWSCGRLLLGFENGRIAVLHLPVSNDSTGTARLEWLSRNHGSQRVVHLRAVNDSCFASASASQLQIGTANDVLLEYRSDEGIRDFVYMPGQQPQTYVNEGTGTLLEVVGDVSQFLPE